MDCEPKLRFPEFSGEWVEKRFGNFCSLQMGQSPSSKNYTEDSNDTILIQGNADLKQGNVVPRIYTTEITKTSDPGDIILTVRAPVGDIAINRYFACIGRGVCSIKGDKFVYFLLDSLNEKAIWKKFAQGSTFEAISSKDIKNLKVNIPNLKEQQKIASFLSKVDSKIDVLEKKQELWKTYKKGIMQQIFNQKLRFKDENGEEYPDWEEKKFNQIFNFIPTNSFSRVNLNYETGDVYNIHYGDIHTKYSILLDFKNTEVPFINDDVNLERIKVESYCKDGDLVIADASEDYEDIGKAIELKNLGNKKVLAGLHTFLARDKAGYSKSGYRSYMLMDESVKLQIKKLATGVSVLGISKSNLGNVSLMVPSLQEQSKIASFLSVIGSKIEQLNKELEINKKLKKGLLQQMFC